MSHNQPGPYGAQPPQQQPGPYGQQPQAPYGQPPAPPRGGGGRKKTGLVIGAVVVVAAAAVGGYLLFAGDDSSSVADDGKTYKLTAPATVLGGYKKLDASAGGGGMSSGDLKDLEKRGVSDPKDVHAAYQHGEGTTMKTFNYLGVYGEVDDPEKVVDAMFAEMEKNSLNGSDGGMKLIGSPKEFTPDGFAHGVMKCQMGEFSMGGEGGAEDSGVPDSFQTPMCAWGDHSTVAYAVFSDAGATGRGKDIALSDVAAQVAELRDDVRVEVK
ncbi:hypothetical protein ABZ383_12280 [Streptomyces sp. NPDC005900]|uniref:hypothetical protein n=1 Tax=Streptomyces sp. NPDC005900 TaxID=3154569 RepID=UPI0033F1ADEC